MHAGLARAAPVVEVDVHSSVARARLAFDANRSAEQATSLRFAESRSSTSFAPSLHLLFCYLGSW